jgi:hypothetical protein
VVELTRIEALPNSGMQSAIKKMGKQILPDDGPFARGIANEGLTMITATDDSK